MSSYKDNLDADSIKKREYLKQQHQLRTMTKSNNILSADDMIENLLSKKEIFKKKEQIPPSKSPQANHPSWLSPGHEPLVYRRVWEIVSTPSGYADTPKLTNILLTSRLPTDVLGYIWSLSNISLAPALSQLETYTNLALVALVQSGYSFTGVAVLNTLKEAPLPKLDYPLTEASQMMPGPVFMPPLQPPVSQQGYSQPSPLSQSFAEFSFPEVKKSPEISSSPLNMPTPASNPPPPGSLSGVADSFSLLDLDLSLPSTAIKPELTIPHSSAPVATTSGHTQPSIDLLQEIPNKIKESESKIKEKELISEFSPTAKKHNNAALFIKPLNESPFSSSNNEAKPSQEPSLMDDLFGDFQCVSVPEQKNPQNDEVEFDDFKSADFTPLTLLEVKEKPPEIEKVEPAAVVKEMPKLHKPEEKAGIEDLFPKCVVKTKEDSFDLLASDEDKYSALRGLTASEDGDEFGDFLTAAPSQTTTLPPPFAALQPNNIQERAMEACIQILEEARKIFESIDEEEVLKEVISDPRGVQYLEELIEVERIAERLKTNLNKEDLCGKLESVSLYLERFLKPHKNSYMAEESGPKCGICLCDKGPSYVKYGINNFHAPCANLYLHRVDSNLPIAPVM